MQKIDQLVQEIIDRATKLGISMQGLARLSGLHKNTLRGIRKKGWSPTTTTIKQLQDTIERLESYSKEELVSYAIKEQVHPPKFAGIRRTKPKTAKPKKTSKSTEQCASTTA